MGGLSIKNNLHQMPENIRPYLNGVLKHGKRTKVGDALGKGRKLIGEIYQAEHTGVYVSGLLDKSDKMIEIMQVCNE